MIIRFKKPLVFILVFLTLFTRFIKLNWGDSFYFHPDENNMAQSVSQLTLDNLNPHFFAYGQFPLLLAFFSLKLIHQVNNFPNSIITLRLWSAIFSALAVFIFYLISRNLFKNGLYYLIFTLLIIFSPGLIELAHFGTTESLLTFVFAANIYLSLNYLQKPKNNILVFSAIVSAIGLASKITAVFFILPILLSLIFTQKIKKIFLFIPLTIILFLIFSPYDLLDFSNFKSAIAYETAVATGKDLVFYTRQFLHTVPYFFQFAHVFPYVLGLPIFIFGIIGFMNFIFYTKRQILHTKYHTWLIILIPAIIYVLYNGQLFTKWTRFMSPVFFLFPLFTTFFLTKIKNKTITVLIVILCLIPGIIFLNLYFQPDIRLQASVWMNSHIPQNSVILSEAGNVVNLPLESQLNVKNFDFYTLDNNDLAAQLVKSDYIIIPSRRVFKNYSYNYYRYLFSGQLGFIKIKEFSPTTDILLNPENAEETWTVFDRPNIRIYQKVKPLTLSQYQQLLQ